MVEPRRFVECECFDPSKCPAGGGVGNVRCLMALEPAPPSFKPGDTVKLKSGGPSMSVQSTRRTDGYVECWWFDASGAPLHTNVFHRDSLAKVER